MNRRKIADVLSIAGYALLCIPVALVAAQVRGAAMPFDAAAVVAGTACLVKSLRMRGYPRDARFIGAIGAVSVLCIIYAWRVS